MHLNESRADPKADAADRFEKTVDDRHFATTAFYSLFIQKVLIVGKTTPLKTGANVGHRTPFCFAFGKNWD